MSKSKIKRLAQDIHEQVQKLNKIRIEYGYDQELMIVYRKLGIILTVKDLVKK